MSNNTATTNADLPSDAAEVCPFTGTVNPPLAIPVVWLGYSQWVVRDATGGDALITYTETPEGQIETSRMTSESDRDLLIFPEASNGTEVRLSARRAESLRFSEREDGELGLQVLRTFRDGGSEEFTISGYARVFRID